MRTVYNRPVSRTSKPSMPVFSFRTLFQPVLTLSLFSSEDWSCFTGFPLLHSVSHNPPLLQRFQQSIVCINSVFLQVCPQAVSHLLLAKNKVTLKVFFFFINGFTPPVKRLWSYGFQVSAFMGFLSVREWVSDSCSLRLFPSIYLSY